MMEWSALFFLNSIVFGVGLAMDAFSVSMANGLNEPHMKTGRMSAIAGTFGGFQIAMPILGWLCVHTISVQFKTFQRFIPWIALLLLAFIGGKMLYEGIEKRTGEGEVPAVGFLSLMAQGIATSIDALSVGFAIADYPWSMALTEALIIGIVTFGICIGGLMIGKRFGTRLSDKAQILGGVILIAIGLEIFVRGVL